MNSTVPFKQLHHSIRHCSSRYLTAPIALHVPCPAATFLVLSIRLYNNCSISHSHENMSQNAAQCHHNVQYTTNELTATDAPLSLHQQEKTNMEKYLFEPQYSSNSAKNLSHRTTGRTNHRQANLGLTAALAGAQLDHIPLLLPPLSRWPWPVWRPRRQLRRAFSCLHVRPSVVRLRGVFDCLVPYAALASIHTHAILLVCLGG